MVVPHSGITVSAQEKKVNALKHQGHASMCVPVEHRYSQEKNRVAPVLVHIHRSFHNPTNKQTEQYKQRVSPHVSV